MMVALSLDRRATMERDHGKGKVRKVRATPPEPCTDTIAIGDSILFWSSEDGGKWKPGVAVDVYKCMERKGGNKWWVRISVGNNIYLKRPLTRCKRAT